MHVCAPPFGLEVGVDLRKRNEIEKFVAKKMYERYVCLENGKNDMKSKKKKRSFWRSTIFDHHPSCGFGKYTNVWS